MYTILLYVLHGAGTPTSFAAAWVAMSNDGVVASSSGAAASLMVYSNGTAVDSAYAWQVPSQWNSELYQRVPN